MMVTFARVVVCGVFRQHLVAAGTRFPFCVRCGRSSSALKRRRR